MVVWTKGMLGSGSTSLEMWPIRDPSPRRQQEGRDREAEADLRREIRREVMNTVKAFNNKKTHKGPEMDWLNWRLVGLMLIAVGVVLMLLDR